MPSESPSFRQHIHKGASVGGRDCRRRRSIWQKQKTLIRQRYNEFSQKNPLEVLTVSVCGRIVRFFAAAEAAERNEQVYHGLQDD
ncbi:hypothetical protein H8A10_02080 [Neisseria meningitidis]|nr:hypothetical protein [Neisseria meningitidis]MBJ7785382.1 hypothetical protein [Neisseria meningitidis]